MFKVRLGPAGLPGQIPGVVQRKAGGGGRQGESPGRQALPLAQVQPGPGRVQAALLQQGGDPRGLLRVR